jgi:Tol biopolymer transport system component/predicted Ser/Thr protein kinase
MSLAAGVRLGPYDIQSAIGAGGMGEVYSARDTRLDRVVAVKVLPAHVASDPDLKQRFEREAKTLAALSHPHICPVYDVGQQDGIDFLVMEYLDGQTLATRLEKGALPLDQALQYAIQIADALDKAHRKAIVHRDLKPGNVMLTKSGVKLLDFGLAKLQPIGAVSGSSVAATMTSPLTGRGTILGTLQYMAPEQVEGRDADARSDIFSFGVVLYEMTTGKRAFDGKSAASIMAAILEREPPAMSSLQPLTPPVLDHVVRRCLAKDPDERWQAASDVMRELKWIGETGGSIAQAAAASPLVTRASRRGRMAWFVAAAALVVAVAAIAAVLARRPEPIVTQLEVVTPPTSEPFSFALSPDGRQLAFVAVADGAQRVWVRRLDQGTARSLAGTDGASYPFWNPDGTAVGFFADGKLKRIDAAGGAPQSLTDVPGARGGTWNQDGVIVFAPQAAGLMRIAATGGTPVALTELAPGQGSHRWPQFLPDGRRFLFFSLLGQTSTHGVYLGSLDGGAPARLLSGETAAVYTPPGYLLRVMQGALIAHRFDVERGVVSAESVPVAQSVGTDDGAFHSAFSVGGTTLAHRPGAIARRQLVWVDRMGKVTGTLQPPDDAIPARPARAPDGRRVIVSKSQVQGNFDLWMVDVARGLQNRFTFDAAAETSAIWSPDGSRVVFNSNRNGRYDLFEKPANGVRSEQPLLVTDQDKAPNDWSPDGRLLLYASDDPKTRSDLWALPLEGKAAPFPVVQTTANERLGQFSPDGRWLAYVSNETGIDEIFVQPFPSPGGVKWQLSQGGGVDPRWRPGGRELGLFYVAPDDRLMAASVEVEGDGRALNPRAPVALFRTRLATGAAVNIGFVSGPGYAVASDGRFLMNITVDEPTATPISIVLNWAEALDSRVGDGSR